MGTTMLPSCLVKIRSKVRAWPKVTKPYLTHHFSCQFVDNLWPHLIFQYTYYFGSKISFKWYVQNNGQLTLKQCSCKYYFYSVCVRYFLKKYNFRFFHCNSIWYSSMTVHNIYAVIFWRLNEKDNKIKFILHCLLLDLFLFKKKLQFQLWKVQGLRLWLVAFLLSP